jgi:tetratricopeptide (TPR) repeat protein
VSVNDVNVVLKTATSAGGKTRFCDTDNALIVDIAQNAIYTYLDILPLPYTQTGAPNAVCNLYCNDTGSFIRRIKTSRQTYIRFAMSAASAPAEQTLCLNMIVRNESAVIERLLASVAPLVADYVICDTGSTDDTVARIGAFMAARGIPGHVVDDAPFVDFGRNRSSALEHCRRLSKSTYALLLDADMVLDGPADPAAFRAGLVNDVYMLFQQNGGLIYKNTRLVRNAPGFSYWGVTHEYLATPPGTTSGVVPHATAHIKDVGDGGSKGDKVQRDIRLLTQGLVDVPNNDRYTFYLANSYRDAGENAAAITHYRKRIALGGWAEECWASYYAIGNCYARMGEHEKAVYAWMEGYDHSPHRVETLYEIAKHFRVVGKQKLAQAAYARAVREMAAHPSRDHLFLQQDVYDYKLHYEMSVVGYYHNPDNLDLAALSTRVLCSAGVEESLRNNVLANYKFYAKPLRESAGQMLPENAETLARLGKAVMGQRAASAGGEFFASTPSVCRVPDTDFIAVCTRFVNYRIDDSGGYINKEHITTINTISILDVAAPVWRLEREFELRYDSSRDGRYVGLEDVRLSPGDSCNTLVYNANRGVDGEMHVEHGLINLDVGECVDSSLLKYSKRTGTEKNWVLLPSTPGAPERCVYGWSPLIVGEISATRDFVVQHTHDTPPMFKHVRGSTNGVAVGAEIWFITHIVSYDSGRRWYYHCLVALDAATSNLARWSAPFVFEKSNPVEYTLGFCMVGADVLIGYSVLDRETKYVTVHASTLDALMVNTR